MLKYAPYVLKGLTRHWARTLLTASGAAVALFVFVFIGAARQGVADMTRGPGAERVLVVFQANRFCPSTSRLPESYAGLIRKVQGVRSVVPIQVFVNNCRASLDLVLMHGIPPEQVGTRDIRITSGDASSFASQGSAALAGRGIAARRGLRPGQPFSVGDITVNVTALFEAATPAEENLLYVPLRMLQLSKGRSGAGLVTQLEVTLDDSADPLAVAREIDALLRDAGVATDTRPRGLFRQGVVGDLAELIGWAAWLGYACVGLVLALVAATATMNTRDRLREHATLQAIGYTGWHVFWLVLSEVILLGLVGGMTGVLGGLAVLWWAGIAVGTEGVTIALAPSWSLLLEGLGVSLAVGVVAGLAPAWAASSAEIVPALREA
jgi:putative ABC transport system permease protein